jgi:hypothetical protein
MDLLDRNCWILEPLMTTKTNTKRRINISNYVSMQVNVDARNPRELPELTFLGPESCKL